MADYINGREMYEELKVYHAQYLDTVKNGEDKPTVSKKLAECFIQIATRLMNSFNFVNYTYKDEMISDGILQCLNKVHRFDPSISEQSFAFFSQICWNAAINRIKIEQRETSTKARMINEMLSSEFVEHAGAIECDDTSNSFVQFLKENDVMVDHIATKKNKIHSSLMHRNKTEYKRKAVVVKETTPTLEELMV